MQSADFSVSAAASTSAGLSASFAPFTTRILFCPFGSTKIGATPLDNPSTCFTCVGSIPCLRKFSIVAGPNRSLPTRATINTSAPHSRAATAWFAPLPPKPRSNFCPKMVSPGLGNWSLNVVRSTFALPITAMRGRFAIVEFLDEMPGPSLLSRVIDVNHQKSTGRASNVNFPWRPSRPFLCELRGQELLLCAEIRRLGLGVGSKEIPNDVCRDDSRARIEVRVVRNVARNIHGDAKPFVVASDELVELHLGVSRAARGIFLHYRGNVSLRIAQGGGRIEAGTAIRQRSSPIVE